MKRPTGATVGNMDKLAHLWELAQHVAQRPGDAGGALKVLEMLMSQPDFKPKNGGWA